MLILKIGGGRDINVDGIAEDLSALSEPAVVVHGANAWRDDLAARLGAERKVLTSASGYESTYSDDEAIDVLLMAYAGLRNKRLVEAFARRGIRALGLTGLDGGLVRGRRNPGIRSLEGGKVIVRRDHSGKPTSVNEPLLRMLLEAGYLPVLTVPIADENGTALNSENDDVVALLQGVLGAETVVQLIEAPGILDDPSEATSLVPQMNPAELARREGSASGRFKRKLHGIGKLFRAAPCRVLIGDGRAEHPLRDVLDGRGTVIS